jgi:hypothetical protein
MDIEGGEYEILGDSRIEKLEIGAVVMEAHPREKSGGVEDKRWCEQRFRDLGFTVEDIFTEPWGGMFWAFRY